MVVCGSGPVHINGQHLEEDAESKDKDEKVKLLSISGKLPQKKVKFAAKDNDEEK